jgi:hypothetical protein
MQRDRVCATPNSSLSQWRYPGNVRLPARRREPTPDKRQTIGLLIELTDSGNEATATITLPHRSRRLRRAFSAFWCDWFLRGRKRTFSPFNSRVITTYTLKISAAGDGDNRGHTFPAFQAVRRSIHWTLPILPQTRKPERLFHQYITSTVAAVLACDHFFAARDQAGCLTPAESRPFALARANEVG